MTDIKMENESGIDLIKKIRKNDKDIKVVITLHIQIWIIF